ncbi:MAG: hypothetical protein AB4206_00670 [Xenococcaceae cyanobacterium]
MFQLVYYYFAEAIEPFTDLLRFCCACLLLTVCIWSLFSFVIDAIARAKQMHRIPCTQCRFFTNNYTLKCTVNPHIANTEKAIDCSDYQNN